MENKNKMNLIKLSKSKDIKTYNQLRKLHQPDGIMWDVYEILLQDKYPFNFRNISGWNVGNVFDWDVFAIINAKNRIISWALNLYAFKCGWLRNIFMVYTKPSERHKGLATKLYDKCCSLNKSPMVVGIDEDTIDFYSKVNKIKRQINMYNY